MKKRKLFLIVATAIMLIMTACGGGGSFSDPGMQESNNAGSGENNGGGGGNSGGGGKGGTFTLTDIPSEYNGKYAFLVANGGSFGLYGYDPMDIFPETTSLPRISNGKVSIPLWKLNLSGDTKPARYSGNDVLTTFVVYIEDSEGETIVFIIFDSVAFSNGNSTKLWNDGYSY
jgi:hypothetical protein